jgi:hypothetical protein
MNGKGANAPFLCRSTHYLIGRRHNMLHLDLKIRSALLRGGGVT